MSGSKVTVAVEGQQLQLSNMDKVLFPAAGFSKGDVVDYYRRAAPAMVPHLADRAATLIRFPDGVDGDSFYEKNVSRHAPDWVRTVALRSGARGAGEAVNEHVVVGDLPTLVWTANLAALELHVPQWQVGPAGQRHLPDLLVFDLDPGEPATIVECCRTAERLRDILLGDGLRPYPKTSGSKGMQLYCPVRTTEAGSTAHYAHEVAQRLERDHPDEVVAKMAKAARGGKVFLDWSQNNPAKTTVAPYSLRARTHPGVSTPITWDEVCSCAHERDLRFSPAGVLDRIERDGDLLADLHREPAVL